MTTTLKEAFTAKYPKYMQILSMFKKANGSPQHRKT